MRRRSAFFGICIGLLLGSGIPFITAFDPGRGEEEIPHPGPPLQVIDLGPSSPRDFLVVENTTLTGGSPILHLTINNGSTATLDLQMISNPTFERYCERVNCVSPYPLILNLSLSNKAEEFNRDIEISFSPKPIVIEGFGDSKTVTATITASPSASYHGGYGLSLRVRGAGWGRSPFAFLKVNVLPLDLEADYLLTTPSGRFSPNDSLRLFNNATVMIQSNGTIQRGQWDFDDDELFLFFEQESRFLKFVGTLSGTSDFLAGAIELSDGSRWVHEDLLPRDPSPIEKPDPILDILPMQEDADIPARDDPAQSAQPSSLRMTQLTLVGVAIILAVSTTLFLMKRRK